MIRQFSLNREAIRQALTIMVVIAGIWLAVAYDSMRETLLVIGVGVILLLVPPLQRYSRRLLLVSAAILLWSSLSLLPAFLIPSAFRSPLIDHGLVLGPTLSPQPWLTLEDITLLGTSLLWALNCLGGKLSQEKRRVLLICQSLLVLPVAIGVLIPHEYAPGFTLGQFVNRSETGDTLLMGGLACFACGCLELMRKKGHGVWWFLLTLVYSMALARNQSRAAFVIYFVGLVIYLCLLPNFRRSPKLVFSSLAAVFFFIVCGLGMEGTVIEKRFQDFATGKEMRQDIFSDTLSLIGRNPVCGVGLGNFEGVFNTERFYTSHIPYRMSIVESDWLGLGAELGIPGVVLFVLLLTILYLDYFTDFSATPMTPFSLAVGISFFIHSLFDVGGHQMGTCWNCLFLVGLGAVRNHQRTDIAIPTPVWRVFGVILLLVAGLRLQSGSFNPWMPTRHSSDLIEDILTKHPTTPPAERKLLDRDISWFPLNWLLYYQRGLVTLQIPELAKGSIQDFRASIFLEQNAPELPTFIDSSCRNLGTPEALAARNEILPLTLNRSPGLFGTLYDPSLDHPDEQGLSTLAKGDPSMQLMAVLAQPPDQFNAWRANYLKAHDSFEGLPRNEIQELFDRWSASDDAPDLIKEWADHPNWKPPGWKASLRTLAKMGRFSDAVTNALSDLGTKRIPNLAPNADVRALKSSFEDTHDVFYGVQYYLALSQRKDDSDAEAVLEELSKDPSCPDYVLCILGTVWHREGKDEAAWRILAPLVDRA